MSDDATPTKVRVTGVLGALVESLRACADDPMWADHAEVPKRLCVAAARALEETSELAGHYMAQRDEARRALEWIEGAIRRTEVMTAEAEALIERARIEERERCAKKAAPDHIQYSDDEWRVRCEVRDSILDSSEDSTC